MSLKFQDNSSEEGKLIFFLTKKEEFYDCTVSWPVTLRVSSLTLKKKQEAFRGTLDFRTLLRPLEPSPVLLSLSGPVFLV